MPVGEPYPDIVAFPFQVPANAAGIVAPVVGGGGDVVDVVGGAVVAGLLVLPASGLDGIAFSEGRGSYDNAAVIRVAPQCGRRVRISDAR